MTAETIVAKLLNYCHVLRDDGLSYGDYVGLFHKRAEDIKVGDGQCSRRLRSSP